MTLTPSAHRQDPYDAAPETHDAEEARTSKKVRSKVNNEMYEVKRPRKLLVSCSACAYL